ncbi:MAG: hypothetical protein ACI81W_001933 [Saprospiraceae bacterium]|jgi:hypothetical protein
MKKPTSTKNDGPVIHLIPREVISISIFILLSTALIIWCFTIVYQKIEAFQFQESVNWENQYKYDLDAVPSWFWYKSDSKQLLTIKEIDDKAKTNLLNLYPADILGYAAYKSAIDELAFKTNQNTSSLSYLWTLLLGSLAAMIGAQLRTIYRFIQRACYFKNLDAKIWWPWYVFRPLEALILGAMVVLLSEVNLLNFKVDETSNLFWIGLAALAGFGAPDVIRRLKMLSKTIFGFEEENEKIRTNKE